MVSVCLLRVANAVDSTLTFDPTKSMSDYLSSKFKDNKDNYS